MLALFFFLAACFVVYNLLYRAHPRDPNILHNHAPLADRQDEKPAGEGSSKVHDNDASTATVVAVPAEDEKSSVIPAASSSSSSSQGSELCRQGVEPALPNPSVPTLASAASISSLGSFVNRFSELQVNTTRSRLGFPAATEPGSSAGRTTWSTTRGATPSSGSSAGPTQVSITRGATPFSLSPLSSPPTTPPSSPSPSPTPTLYLTPTARHPRILLSNVDFSLYKKKTRALTKSPKKPQTKAAGKLPALAANDVTVTAWFYRTMTESKLLETPPNLIEHPDGLFLGDIYFDRVGDVYQLWLWCLDNVGEAHWKKVPFGYERGDGKRLIVTPKNFLLSWVAPSYYKQVGSGEGCSMVKDHN